MAGRRPEKRRQVIELTAQALREHSAHVEVVATKAPGSAGAQAAEACERGTEIVFACGGDGTVHDVLQGMVLRPHAVLGVLPLGTANTLARHLRLPLHPVRAALQQLQRSPQLVPVGLITYQTPIGERLRYFTVMAGAGPDGALVYKMLASGKQRLGRMTYYLRAGGLFLRSRFTPFQLTCTSANGDAITSFPAVSAMAVRVGELGGLFSPLVRGASVHHTHLLIAAALSPARLSLPAWFSLSWLRAAHLNPYVRTFHVKDFHCGEGETAPVQVQADGEWLGRTPMTVTLVPSALRLLLP